MTEVATSTESVNVGGFDYSEVDHDLAEILKGQAQRIKREIRNQTRSILVTGALLIEVKSRLPHGLFSRWVTDELGVTVRTAENYVRAAGLASECESETISLLAPTTLYLLAAMPPDAKSEALLKLQATNFNVKAFESEIRAAGSKKSEPALVAIGNDDQLKAAEEIDAFLRRLLDRDNYFLLCELIASLSVMGDPTSLRAALVAVFVERGQAIRNSIKLEHGSDDARPADWPG